MNAIRPTFPTPQVSPVNAPQKVVGTRAVAGVLSPRAADNASGLHSASSLRIRLAESHAESNRLFDTARTVDAADEALFDAEGLLKSAQQVIGDPNGVVDPILLSIENVTGRARMGGIAILHEGATLNAGGAVLDVRPMSISDLGAVVEQGRSHRLIDLRAGGALDARTYPDAARRSTNAALSEIAAARSQLHDFGTSAVRPELRAGLAALHSVTGASPVTVPGEDAIAIRNVLLGDARTARGALMDSSPEGVLRLLG